MRRLSIRQLGLVCAALVFAADQESKLWIVYGLRLPEIHRIDLLPNLSFTSVDNYGMTFGLLSGLGAAGPFVLAGGALAVVTGLAFWLWRAENRRVAIGLGMIGGGALGNVFDRIRLGHVIDFIHFHIGDWSWFVFNVADAAIDCGVALLVIDSLLTARGVPAAALPASDAAIRKQG